MARGNIVNPPNHVRERLRNAKVAGTLPDGNYGKVANWGSRYSNGTYALKGRDFVTFNIAGYMKELNDKIDNVSKRLQRELMEEIKFSAFSVVYEAGPWPATIYDKDGEGENNTKMFDGPRLAEIKDTIVMVGEQVKRVGEGLAKREFGVKALGKNRNIDSVGFYYEFGTGEINDAPKAMTSSNSFRSNNWGKPIVGRGLGTWTDIGGNKRWASGKKEGVPLPYAVTPKRWFRNPVREVFDRCIAEYAVAVRSVNPLKYIEVVKRYKLGYR